MKLILPDDLVPVIQAAALETNLSHRDTVVLALRDWATNLGALPQDTDEEDKPLVEQLAEGDSVVLTGLPLGWRLSFIKRDTAIEMDIEAPGGRVANLRSMKGVSASYVLTELATHGCLA